MYRDHRVGVVIPAYNEEESVGLVVRDLLALKNDEGDAIMDSIVVCNNASTDDTERVARDAGATVVFESRPGYGSACLKGIASLPQVDIVLFLDGDRSDRVENAFQILDAVIDGADLVIGSRELGQAESGSVTPQQRFGNALASFLIRIIWDYPCTDLGPFRAMKKESLDEIEMADPDYGWTVEMQVKAMQKGMKVVEVPADYRVRIGESKISGTIRGTIGAGTKILWTIGKFWIKGLSK